MVYHYFVFSIITFAIPFNPVLFTVSTVRHLLHRDKIELGVPSLQIQAETEAWVVFNQPTK